MAIHLRTVLTWVAVTMLASSAALCADEAKDEKPADSSESKPARFRPPSRGAPESRIGGGVRGGDEVMLIALVPRQIALTVSPQPRLYWYMDRAAEAQLQLSITRLDNYETIYEVDVAAGAPGIASHPLPGDFKLEPSVQYEWTLTLLANKANPSQNPVTGGWLTLVDEGEAFKAAVKDKPPMEKVASYAERGIWYDALRVLEEAIAAAPDDAELRSLRQSLFTDENVGLGEVAAGLAKAAGE